MSILAGPALPHPSPDAPARQRRRWLTLAAIVLLAMALRLYQIDAQSLWTDEWMSVRGAHRIEDANRHRPLYYLLLRPWMKLGDGDAWLRLPAVIFGLGGIVLLYLLGRRLVGSTAALVACLVMALAVPELDHSQEVRMYTMAAALTLGSVLALIHFLGHRRWWALALHVILTYCAFLTTPTVIFGLLVAGGFGGLTLWRRRRWNDAIAMIVGYGLIAAAWWPLYRYAKLALYYGSLDWIDRPAWSAPILLHGQLLSEGLGANRSPAFQWIVSMLTLILVAIGLAVALRRGRRQQQVAWIAGWFYIVLLGMFLVSLIKRPVWTPRYFHYTAPALYLLIGCGIAALGRWRRPAGWLSGILLVGLIGVAVADYYRLDLRENWRAVGESVGRRAVAGDVVVVIGPDKIGLFQRYDPNSQVPVSGAWPQLQRMPAEPDAVLAGLIDQIPPHAGRTWMILRDDYRFHRYGEFLPALVRYLRDRGTPPEVHVFTSIQGNLIVIAFGPRADRA